MKFFKAFDEMCHEIATALRYYAALKRELVDASVAHLRTINAQRQQQREFDERCSQYNRRIESLQDELKTLRDCNNRNGYDELRWRKEELSRFDAQIRLRESIVEARENELTLEAKLREITARADALRRKLPAAELAAAQAQVAAEKA